MKELRPCCTVDKVIYLSDITINRKYARARDYMTFLYGLLTSTIKLWECISGGGEPSSPFKNLSFAEFFKVKGISHNLCPPGPHSRKDA